MPTDDDRTESLTAPTPAMLAFAGLADGTWRNDVYRSIYTELPPTDPKGRFRFGADDLTAAYVLGELRNHHVLPAVAGEIAGDVRRLLRECTGPIDTLTAWKVTDRHGEARIIVAETAPKPDAIKLFRFEIAEIKYRALELLRQLRAESRA